MCDGKTNCLSFTKKVRIEFIKNEKWDCWGKMVTAFRKGDTVYGTAVIKNGIIYCASAESQIYYGITDFVGLENIKILGEE